eukprot:TRINITY_DN2438_c0_g1_i2.p1 TRINITY_DN2438_c0_g1~~TRINITY_DN2438_c0_g1_i2.p1  ORF type:complete len:341 (-),score=49.53 TRINITY_DN2438_c0_g1_i2:128-1150(-)
MEQRLRGMITYCFVWLIYSRVLLRIENDPVLSLPKKFITQLRKDNELFRSYMHQDAHEFLNYILNVVSEMLTQEQKEKEKRTSSIETNNSSSENEPSSSSSSSSTTATTTNDKPNPSSAGTTFVHEIFEGLLTNETRCLSCECITSKDESFLDLSIDIQQNTSLVACLSAFSEVETLAKGDKFYCDKCCSLQEAQKRMKIKRLPQILVVHLKRFKYIEQIQQYKKLSYRVVFPFELILQNTSHDAQGPDRRYNLFAVVIHVGSGPNHGHYISMVKSHGHWLIYDDDNIDVISENDIATCFGSSHDVMMGSTDCGYLLFYQSESATMGKSSSTYMNNNGHR